LCADVGRRPRWHAAISCGLPQLLRDIRGAGFPHLYLPGQTCDIGDTGIWPNAIHAALQPGKNPKLAFRSRCPSPRANRRGIRRLRPR